MFEHHSDPLLPGTVFLRRLIRYGAIAAAIVVCSLGLGVAGYHYIEELPWVDALVNAAMILGGMGPVNALRTTGGKLFAAFYALFSGLVFLVVVAVVFAPLIHRLLHYFHLDLDKQRGEG